MSTKASAADCTAITNALVTVNAAANEVGAEIWNTVADEISASGKMPQGVPYFTGLDWVNAETNTRYQDVAPRPEHWPTTDDVAFARQRVNEFQAMVNYVKSVAPEVAARVNARQQEVANQVAQMTPIKDPDVVGWDTFKSELEKRAGELGNKLSMGFNLGIVAAVVVGIVLLVGWTKGTASRLSGA